MPPPAPEIEKPSPPVERPWLFNFLIAPGAVIAIGLVNGALSYILRREGVDPARAASIVALLGLPHTIYFLWGPITDFWMRRRTWLMAGGGRGGHDPRCSIPSIAPVVRLGCRPAVSRRLFRRVCGGCMRRHDGHVAQRDQSASRQQFLSIRFAGLRRNRSVCAGVDGFALSPRHARVDRGSHGRPAVAGGARRSCAGTCWWAQRARDRGAHLAGVQVHFPALGGHTLHLAGHVALLQRRHDRPAACPCRRLRCERTASGMDQWHRGRPADDGRSTGGFADPGAHPRAYCVSARWPFKRRHPGGALSRTANAGRLFHRNRALPRLPSAPATRCLPASCSSFWEAPARVEALATPSSTRWATCPSPIWPI